MLIDQSLPPEIAAAASGESKDFAVKAKRFHPRKSVAFVILFGVFWLGLIGIFVAAFFGPLITTGESSMTINGVPTIVTIDNLEKVYGLIGILGGFSLIGFAMIALGIKMLFAKGGWYLGTAERLIIIQKGRTRSIDWEQFSGDITVKGNQEEGIIVLGMRTGEIVEMKNGGRSYASEIVSLVGIPNPQEIEKICRKRIKENDPTPTKSRF